jgi:uncharacterized protein (TIGR02453 family)
VILVTAAKRSFEPGLFAFLRELREHNDRDWFAANKSRFEELVREPALEFVSDFAPGLARISPRFVADARPVGGSLFRIHRDVRFSRDKTPYKTHVGIHFRHEQAKTHYAPGFYLHLEPDNVIAGVGIWHPDPPTLRQIRDAIVADPDAWTRATTEPPFAPTYTLSGESLKRPPAGFPADHPLIEDLKRKSVAGVATSSEAHAVAPGFLGEWEELCDRAAPFMRFVCDAVGVPFA